MTSSRSFSVARLIVRSVLLLTMSIVAHGYATAQSSLVTAYTPQLCTGSGPACFEGASGVFQVLVQDSNNVITPVQVYLNDRGGNSSVYYHFAHFAFSGTVIVHVLTPESTVTSASISPQAFGISAVLSQYSYLGTTYGQVRFSLTQSRYLILKIDTHNELVIAADPPETNVPASSGSGVFNVVTSYGAVTDGSSETTSKFLSAISDASSYGTAGSPGIVYVPNGIYIVGQLMLRSNVTLYLAPNAVIQASQSPSTPYLHQYYNGGSNYGTPNTPGGTTCSGGCSEWGFWFIYTLPGSSNIAVQGRGVVDGLGSILTDAADSSGTADTNAILDVLFMPLETTNFTMNGIVGWDAGGWSFTPTRSSNVAVENYKAMQSLNTFQDDGFDVQESQGVTLSHVIAISRDDSYTTKTWHDYPQATSGTLCWAGGTEYISSYLGVGSCWPGSPQELANVAFNDVVSWTTDGSFKIGQGTYQAQFNISVDGLYVYKANNAIYLDPNENTSGSAPPVSYVNLSNIYIENCSHWLYFDTIGVVVSNLTLSNVNVGSAGDTTSYTAPSNSTAYLNSISFENVSINGMHLSDSASLTGGFQNLAFTGETFLQYDASNPIFAASYSTASPASSGDITVQGTTDPAATPSTNQLEDVELTQSGDNLEYADIDFGISSPSITLRVNPSASGVILNLYAGSTSSAPVGTWTSPASGWQTTSPIPFTASGVTTPLMGKRGFFVGMGSGSGNVHVNWMQPTLTTVQAESATLAGGAVVNPSCSSCSGGEDVESVVNGASLKFPSRNYTSSSGAATEVINLRLASAAFRQGSFLLYLDSPSGTPIGGLSVPSTGGWYNWQSIPVPITATTGTHTLYVVASCSNTINTTTLTDADDDTQTPLSSYPTCYSTGLAIANIDFISF